MIRIVVLCILAATLLHAADRPARQDKPHVFLIGDSTMCHQPANKHPMHGWGQCLPEFMADTIVVENHARGGRSTRSFRDQGLWQAVLERLRPGDFVLIQFGHNDQKKDEARAAAPFGAYQENLRRYIRETREKGAEPILVTSVHRRVFNDAGKIRNSLGEYPAAARQVAAAEQVMLVDLYAASERLFNELGPEGTRTKVFCHLAPGDSPNYPRGRQDNSHFRVEGARLLAGLVVEAIRAGDSPLRRHLKPPEIGD